MKTILTILLTRLISLVLRLTHHNAGNVPGRIALKFNPHIRDRLKTTGKIIVVTGTNGKTTTTNILAEIIKQTGKKVVVNSGGNNIAWGITTTLLQNANLKGEIDCDFLLLETDEHWVPVIYAKPNLQIDTLIVLDFFRDQLDRAGEMETLVEKLTKFVKKHPCNLVLNGDDPNVVRIGLANQNTTANQATSTNQNPKTTSKIHSPHIPQNLYYGLAELPTSYKISHDKMEGIICPNCKLPLVYDFYQYSHLGRFHCPNCDYANPPLATEVTKIVDDTFTVRQNLQNLQNLQFSNQTSKTSKKSTTEVYQTTNENLYHIYNLLAILTVANLYGFDQDAVKHVFATYESKNGRYQTFRIGAKKATLNLCKNPTGFNVVMRSIKHNGTPKDLLLVLNDHINDGYDVSWIWDIDFTDLTEFDKIVCSGTRAYDMAIPVKCNNFDPEKIVVKHDIDAAIDELLKGHNRKYVISNYSPLVQVQKALTKLENPHE